MINNNQIKFLFIALSTILLMLLLLAVDGVVEKKEIIKPSFYLMLSSIPFLSISFFYSLNSLHHKNKTEQKMIKFIGKTNLHLLPNIYRSSDNRCQFRVAKDLEYSNTYWHFEYLAPDGITITEETTMLAPYKYFEDEKAKRRIADYYFIALVQYHKRHQRVTHYWGNPPLLTNKRDERRLLECPHFLFIREENQGVSLYHLSKDGAYLGGTWHSTLSLAKQQATYEYGSLLGEWHVLPSRVRKLADIVKWVTQRNEWLRKRESGSS